MINVNKEFFYSGNHIIKLWEQYLKGIDPNIKFYSNDEVVDSIFYNGLQQTKEVVIVLNNDDTPYTNKNGQTITLSGEISYNDNSAATNIKEAIKQILHYNNQQFNHTKITKHIIVFPYHPSRFHWNLGNIEFFIQENKIISVSINIYEPFGGQNTKGEHYLQNVIQQLSNLQDAMFIEKKLDHPRQQNDATSCGAITAENGKEFLNQGNSNDLLVVIYPAGAEDLRKQHISEINDDNFYKEQLANKEYEAKGDEPLANAAEILAALKLLIGKEENNWVKDIMLTIKSIHNSIKANSEDNKNKNEKLELFKEFLITYHSSHELEDKILNGILKNNLQWREGAIDLIITLAGSVVVQDENIAMNVGNKMEKPSILKFNSIDSTVDVQLENFRSNKPVTIGQVILSQNPTYTMSHLLAAGFRGSDYQLLVLMDKLTELLINNESFEAMVEVDSVGNLDDVVILRKNQDAVTDIEAYQIKYYNHSIAVHDFFNKIDKTEKTKNAKDNKMHIGKFFDGWLEWKKKHPNLPEEKLNSILYSNAALDNIFTQLITSEGKFKENFIDGCSKVSVNRKSDKLVIVHKNFLTKSAKIKFSEDFSSEIHSHLSKNGFLDAEKHFTEKYDPNITAVDLGLTEDNLPNNKNKKNSQEIITEIKNRLIILYNLNQIDLLELLYKETFNYLKRKGRHKDICSTDEDNCKKLFKKFLQSFKFYTQQNNIEKLEEEIQEKIMIILKNPEYKKTPYQVSTVYLCLYYAIRDWFRKEYSNNQVPKLTKELMLDFLKKALICSQDIVFLQGQSEAILQEIKSKINHPLVFRSELSNLKEMLNKPRFVLVKGESGIGKSTLVQQALKDNVPRGEYLIVSGKNIANNPDLQNKFLSVLKEAILFQVVVIDGAEHLNISPQLENILNIMENLKLTVLLTISDDINQDKMNDLEKLIPDDRLVLQVEPLNHQEILKVYPELTEFQTVISLVELAKIPFYLNIIIEQKNNIDLNFAASAPAKLKSYIISLQIKEKELLHSINKSETLLQRFANRSLAASEIIFDIPRNFKFIAETLIRKGILIKIDSEKCMFSHDIYYNWAVDSWITSEFTRCVEILDDWNQFLEPYSSYSLGNWFKKNIENICDHLVNFKELNLTIDSIEKFLVIIGSVIKLQLDKKSGEILSSILFTIWQDSFRKKHELAAEIRETNFTEYNLLPEMFVKMNDRQIQTKKQIEKIFEYACVLQFLNFEHIDSRFVELLTNSKGYQSYKKSYGVQFSIGALKSNFDIFELPEVRNILEKQAIDLLFKPMVYKAICQVNPKLFMQLLEKRFVMTEQSVCKIYEHKEIDYYFGLLESENWYPRYHVPVEFEKNQFLLLLATGNHEVIYSIINFVDNACNKFANSGYHEICSAKDPLININFVISREKQITLKGNQLLWSLYRGSQPGLGIIKLALMSLDYWLLEQIKQDNYSVFAPVLDYIIERSKTVATVAVVNSVCVAFKEKLATKALLLLKYRNFFEWDNQRRKDEIRAVADNYDFRQNDLTSLARHLMFYANNRLEISGIIDQHYKELPKIDKQTEQDKNWRIKLCIMDIRKHHVNRYDIHGSTDKLIQLLPVLDDDLKEFLATKEQDNIEPKNSLLKYDEIEAAARFLINKDDYVDTEQLVRCKKIIFQAINLSIDTDEHTKKIGFNFNDNIVAEALVKLFLTSPFNEESYEESKLYLVLGLTHASDAMRIAIVKSVSYNIWKKDPIFANKCIETLFKLAILNFKKLYYQYVKEEFFNFVEKVNDLRSWALNKENVSEESVEFNFTVDECNSRKFSIIGNNAFAQSEIVGLALFLASGNFKNQISKKLYYAYLKEIVETKYNSLKNSILDFHFQLISSSPNLPSYPFAFSGLIGKFLISLPFNEAKPYITSMISISKNWEYTHFSDYNFYSTDKDFIRDLLESLLESAAEPEGFWLLWNDLFIQKDIRSKLLEVFLDQRLFRYIDSSGAYDQFVMKAAEKNIKQFKNSNLFEKCLILAQRISSKNILKVIKIINLVLENNHSFIREDSIQNNILYTLINIFEKNESYINSDEIIKEKILFLINKFSNKSFCAGIIHSKFIEYFNKVQQQIMSTSIKLQSIVSNINMHDDQSTESLLGKKRTYSEMVTSNDSQHSLSTQVESSASQCLSFGNAVENNDGEAKYAFKRQKTDSDFKLTQFELSRKQEKCCDSFVSNMHEEGNICSSRPLEEVKKGPTIIATQEVNCTMPYYSHHLNHNDRAYSLEAEQPPKNLIDRNFYNDFEDDFDDFDLQ